MRLHRDLKPSNVLVDTHGLPHVLDFGVARASVDRQPLTGEGGLVGTLPFMSPAVAGQPLARQRCDLFAVGLMLYEGIVGKRPRPPRTHDWLRIQCMATAPAGRASIPEVPLAVSAVIDRLSRSTPRDRPDAASAAALFRACAEGGAPAEWPEPHAYVGEPPVLETRRRGSAARAPGCSCFRGPPGSGRRRTAEQVRRRALLARRRARCAGVPGRAPGRRHRGDPGRAAGGPRGRRVAAHRRRRRHRPAPGDVAAPAARAAPRARARRDRAGGGARGLRRARARRRARASCSWSRTSTRIDKFTARLLDRLARVAPRELSILVRRGRPPRDAPQPTDDQPSSCGSRSRRATTSPTSTPPPRPAGAGARPRRGRGARGRRLAARSRGGRPRRAGAASRRRRAAPPCRRRRSRPPWSPARCTRGLAGAWRRPRPLRPGHPGARRPCPVPRRQRGGARRSRSPALVRRRRRPPASAGPGRDPGPDRHAARARALLLAEDVACAFAPAVAGRVRGRTRRPLPRGARLARARGLPPRTARATPTPASASASPRAARPSPPPSARSAPARTSSPWPPRAPPPPPPSALPPRLPRGGRREVGDRPRNGRHGGDRRPRPGSGNHHGEDRVFAGVFSWSRRRRR